MNQTKECLKKVGLMLFIIFLISSIIGLLEVKASTTLFSDNFNDGDANGWEVVGSSGWSVVGGQYGIYLSPGLSNTVPVDSLWDNNWRDFIYEVDLRGVEGTDKNIILRFQNTSNFYEIHHTGGRIHFEKVIAGSSYVVSPSVDYPLENGPTYRFKIIINGRKMQVYVDGNLIFDVTDNDPFLESGKIGLRAGTGAVTTTEVWFDNVVVRSLDPLPTPTPTPTPTPDPTIGTFELPIGYVGRPSESATLFKTVFWNKLTAAF